MTNPDRFFKLPAIYPKFWTGGIGNKTPPGDSNVDPKRIFKPEFKAKVVLKALSERYTLAEIGQKFDLKTFPNQQMQNLGYMRT